MSEDNKVMVKAIRPFEGEEGFKNSESEAFPVSRQRAADLKANGLVEEVGAKAAKHDEKSAEAPDNKAAPAPANKAAAKPANK